jgi:diguanylate cyclase (GGDEF)-like protein
VLRGSTGIAYVAAAVVFAWIAGVTWRRRAHNPTVALSLVVVMLGLGLSSLADAVAVASTTERAAAIASLAILPGVGIATGAFACLAFGVFQPQWAPQRWLVAVLMFEPALITVAAATNTRHLWVYRGAGAESLTGSAGWGYGPAFWWHTAYSYLALAVGIGFLAWGWWKAPTAFRHQRLTILLATLIACVANVAWLSRGFGELVDPTPFGFAITGLVIFYAIFRQDLITFSPVARALVFDQIGEAVVVVSPAGKVLDLNPAAVALVRGMNPDAPTRLVGAPADTLFGESLATPGGGEKEIVVELDAARAEFQVRATLLIDRYDRDLGTALVARDVTEANNQVRRLAAAHAQLVQQVAIIDRLRADLAELAFRDSLTGLHNRRHLVEEVESMIAAAERTGESFAVVLVDLDRFKTINDVHGHQAGDAVLVGLAQLMLDASPSHALVARWGGEEFFVALPGTDVATGLAFAEDLRRRWALKDIAVDGEDIVCTLSAGVAAYPASGESMDDLFHAVDRSLYDAKDAGRNLVRAHHPES